MQVGKKGEENYVLWQTDFLWLKGAPILFWFSDWEEAKKTSYIWGSQWLVRIRDNAGAKCGLGRVSLSVQTSGVWWLWYQWGSESTQGFTLNSKLNRSNPESWSLAHPHYFRILDSSFEVYTVTQTECTTPLTSEPSTPVALNCEKLLILTQGLHTVPGCCVADPTFSSENSQ